MSERSRSTAPPHPPPHTHHPTHTHLPHTFPNNTTAGPTRVPLLCVCTLSAVTTPPPQRAQATSCAQPTLTTRPTAPALPPTPVRPASYTMDPTVPGSFSTCRCSTCPESLSGSSSQGGGRSSEYHAAPIGTVSSCVGCTCNCRLAVNDEHDPPLVGCGYRGSEVEWSFHSLSPHLLLTHGAAVGHGLETSGSLGVRRVLRTSSRALALVCVDS